MPWTKRELVNQAYSELALQGYEFDITPEEVTLAIKRMDSMVATWGKLNIRLGYALPGSPGDSDPDQDSGIPDTAAEAVYLNLAIRLAAGQGKNLNPATMMTAREAYQTLLFDAAQPIEQQFRPNLPRGAGNKPWRVVDNPFLPSPSDDPLSISPGGNLTIAPE